MSFFQALTVNTLFKRFVTTWRPHYETSKPIDFVRFRRFRIFTCKSQIRTLDEWFWSWLWVQFGSTSAICQKILSLGSNLSLSDITTSSSTRSSSSITASASWLPGTSTLIVTECHQYWAYRLVLFKEQIGVRISYWYSRRLCWTDLTSLRNVKCAYRF